MPIIDQLATSLCRRDEAPNQLLAKQIAEINDSMAIQELVTQVGRRLEVAAQLSPSTYQSNIMKNNVTQVGRRLEVAIQLSPF